MTAASLEYGLLFVCWISALVTLVIFLESWFALSRRSRLATIRSTSTEGVVSVIVPLRKSDASIRRCLQSVLDQSYPFMELLLVHDDRDPGSVQVVREFTSVRSHVPVRPVCVSYSIDNETARMRALDQSLPSIRGSWILVLDPDVILDPGAVESALEFAGSEELAAVALAAGVECRTIGQKLLAPSLEWFVRMISAVDRGREKSNRLSVSAPFLLVNAQTHSVINKLNRMPGILNESGWTLWSFKAEGLRTFQGDGAGWLAREATTASMMSSLEAGSTGAGRVAAFVSSSVIISVVSVLGILFGAFAGNEGFAAGGILYFSAFSYSLMGTSYFCYSRRLGAATWFAPFWFFAHATALFLTLVELKRAASESPGFVFPARLENKTGVSTERS